VKNVTKVAFVHLYATYAIASDGDKTIRIPLTSEQHVQILADSADIVSRIVRWGACHEQSSKDRPDADSGGVRSPGLGR